MKINLTEMMRIKGRMNDINNDMNAAFVGIGQEFDRISQNINSDSLIQSISNIQEKISALGKDFVFNLSELEEFVQDQISGYAGVNEDASASLKQLVALVNTTFDENGNVVMTAAAAATALSSGPSNTTSAPTSTKRADSTIGDSGGYSSGEGLQSTFSSKIGNSDEKWKIVDDTYYYFKDKGLTDEQIAGIIGNMTQESALDLMCPSGNGGYYKGLFQWGKPRYPSSWDFNSQLDHAWEEMGYAIPSYLSNTTTVNDATEKFCRHFEGAVRKDGSLQELSERQNYANAVYYYIKNNL